MNAVFLKERSRCRIAHIVLIELLEFSSASWESGFNLNPIQFSSGGIWIIIMKDLLSISQSHCNQVLKFAVTIKRYWIANAAREAWHWMFYCRVNILHNNFLSCLSRSIIWWPSIYKATRNYDTHYASASAVCECMINRFQGSLGKV